MGPINNRNAGRHRATEPLQAEPFNFEPMGMPVRPTDLVDAEALADMQAFNDLKARRKKQKRKKIIIGVVSAVVLLAVAGGAFAWYAADQTAKALENMAPQTAFVEQGTFTETVSASGNLQPVASVSATPEVDGIVGEVLVAVGDAVEEGQTLFTVVNDDLDKAVNQAAQGIEEAKNGVAQAQNAVNDAYHAKSAGQQAAAQAQAQAQAAAAAAAEAGAAESFGEQASFDEASADSAIRQAELALSNANLALQNAQTAYDEAVARAAKRTVTASIAGSVVAVNIEPGKALGAAGTSTTSPVQIADLSQMTVSINVNEIDILKITADQTAEVSFTAAPDLTLPATVVSIATTSTGSSDGSGGAMYGGHGRCGHLPGEAAHRRARPAAQARHDREGHHHHDHHRQRAHGAHLRRAVRRRGRQLRHRGHRPRNAGNRDARRRDGRVRRLDLRREGPGEGRRRDRRQRGHGRVWARSTLG